MSSPAKSQRKPRLSRNGLKNHGIEFSIKLHERSQLPGWLQPIHQELTRERSKIPDKAKEIFEAELEYEDTRVGREHSCWSLFPAEDEADSKIRQTRRFRKNELENKMEEEFKSCEEIAEKVVELDETNVKESSWQGLLREHFFKPCYSSDGGSDSFNNTLSRWELHQDLHWTEFRSPSDTRDRFNELTYPVPDFTYAFPIIDTTIPSQAKYLTNPLIENFSLPTLYSLRKDGVLSSPSRSLKRWTPKKPTNEQFGAGDLLSFPWCIVEVKPTEWKVKSKKFCYCQAANASAAALTLRENLQRASHRADYNSDALVIFSFTCVGPIVKLWFTYRIEPKKIGARCVWATSLRLTWGVLALRMVIENMREWVNRQVRPELAKWISAARGCPPLTVFLSPGGGHVKQKRRAASLDPPRSSLRITLSSSPIRYSRPADTPPLSGGKTAPSRFDMPEDSESSEYEEEDGRPRKHTSEDSDASENEREADEGYISDHGQNNVQVSDCEDTNDGDLLSERTRHQRLQQERYVGKCAPFCDCSDCLRKLGRSYRLSPPRW